MTTCAACGIEHASAEERDEIHAAVSGVRAWLHEKMLLVIDPPVVEKKPPKTPWGVIIAAKKKEKEAKVGKP